MLLPMIILAAILAVSACSSTSSPGRPVASLPGNTGRPVSSGKLTEAQADQDMVDFARCMRAHGVQMPDPFHRPGHAGLSVEVPVQTAVTRPAWAACTHFIQPIISMKDAHAATEAAPQLAALTRWAQCMRGHDIAMLDPTIEGQLNLGAVPGISGDFGRYSPQFRAADGACRHLLPAGVHDDGTGP
jgi:hypothetical protein